MPYVPTLTPGEVSRVESVHKLLEEATQTTKRSLQVMKLLDAQDKLQNLIQHFVVRGLGDE